MALRVLSTLILLAFLLPTLVDASPAAPTARPALQESRYLVGSDTALAFRPDGNGWGRILLEATEDVALTMTLEHETIDDLGPHSSDGMGTYNESVYTFIYLFEKGEPIASSPLWFEWWGVPSMAFPPRSGMHWGDPPPLSLSAGETAVLVVADRADGYTITISGEEAGAAESLDWALGENPAFHIDIPTERRLPDLQDGAAGAAVRQWAAEVTAPADAVVKAVGWRHENGSGVSTHLARWSIGWRDGPIHTPAPRPELCICEGALVAWVQSEGTTKHPQSISFFFEHQSAWASTRTSLMGAQFLVMPTGPLQSDTDPTPSP